MTGECGCCTGLHAATPRVVTNRPGLPEIAYRSGVHGDFLASMLAGLSAADRPLMAGLRTREPDDPTIALLDAWAVACDVLTFYNERLANESYLATAVERTSLQELGKLIAYRLDPGVAAETHLAFTLERPPATPAGLSQDPGLLPPTTPPEVTLPVGLRVQSVPGPGEKPQVFETVEELTGRPEWNSLPATTDTPWRPGFGQEIGWFAGVGLTLRLGEAILFASPDLIHDRWDVRLVTEVEEDTGRNRTRVRWERGLGSRTPYNDPADAPDSFVLRRRIPVFGYNAPVWRAMNNDFRQGYVIAVDSGSMNDTEWPDFHAVTTSGNDFVVDLDGSHGDINAGDWVVLTRESGSDFYRELYQVLAKAELGRSAFGVSGPVTRLTLSGEGHDFGSPRDVTVLAVQTPLTIVEAPDDSLVSGATFTVEGDASGMAAGRVLVVAGKRSDGVPVSELATLQSATAAGARTTLTFTVPLAHYYERDTAVVYGNVAKATHGQAVHQVLGDGDARVPFQEFPLLQGPLTYVQADNADGSASTLSVSVDGVTWSERASLYDAAPRDRVYDTSTRADGTVVTGFGDGTHGARPPSGSHNLQASYRVGLGSDGNLDVGQLSQPMDRPLGLKAASNPVPAEGGVDPEPPEQARLSIPLTTRTLGRAVSLTDYADFAMAFAGLALADAHVLPLRGGPTIVVTVAGPDGGDAPQSTVQHLTAALTTLGDPLVRVLVLPAVQVRFRTALKVRVAADRDHDTVFTAVETALRAAFAPGASNLATPVHRSSVIAVAAAVPGVVAVDLDLLYIGGPASLQERLLAQPARVATDGTPVASELLALSDLPLDWLEDMS